MRVQKYKYFIDILTSLIYKVQELEAKKKLIIALVINIKKTFDYILKTRFVEKIIELKIYSDLI